MTKLDLFSASFDTASNATRTSVIRSPEPWTKSSRCLRKMNKMYCGCYPHKLRLLALQSFVWPGIDAIYMYYLLSIWSLGTREGLGVDNFPLAKRRLWIWQIASGFPAVKREERESTCDPDFFSRARQTQLCNNAVNASFVLLREGVKNVWNMSHSQMRPTKQGTCL